MTQVKGMTQDHELDQGHKQDSESDNLEQLRARAERVYQDFETHYHSMLFAMQEGIAVQEEISDRMRSLTQFLGHNPNPVLQVTPDGVIRYANVASASLLKRWSCDVNQPVPDDIKALISKVLESDDRLETVVSVDGRFLSLTIAPYSDKQFINIYGLDITDRKLTEVALSESEQATRTLLESAPIGIVIVDDRGNIDMVNNKALAMFGYKQSELVGKPIGKLVPDIYKDVHAQQCMRYRSDPHIRSMGTGIDLNAQRKDGSTFPVEINLGYVRTIRGLLTMSFIVDITQRQQSEVQREHLMRMMVHDLRSPLSSTLTSLEYLKAISVDVLVGDQQKLLEIAINSADKMLKLVNAILDVNRLKSGAMPLVRNVVDLPDIASEVVDEADVLAGEKNIAISMDISKELPPIDVDPNLITRVIQNLVNNAIKFTQEEGSIQLMAWQDQSDLSKLYMAVRDTGPGIPVEIRERLFQEFVTGIQMGRGSGLGLAFCKLALEAHDERIWVDSVAGEGTTFTFTLPVAEEEE
jgi:PAS domain S-box-containing protein